MSLLKSTLEAPVANDYQLGQTYHDLHSPIESGRDAAFSDKLILWFLLPVASLVALLIFLLDGTLSLLGACLGGEEGSCRETWHSGAHVGQGSDR